MEISQKINRSQFNFVGLSFSKRYSRRDQIRIEIVGGFDLGNTISDTITSAISQSYLRKQTFYNGSATLFINIVLPPYNTMDFFFILGTSANIVFFNEKSVSFYDERSDISVDYHPKESLRMWSLAPTLGVGLDFLIRPNFGINISSLLKFWTPITYLDQREMPLNAMLYEEKFMTYITKIALIFNFSKE